MSLYNYQGLEQQAAFGEPFPAGDYNLIITAVSCGAFSSGFGVTLDLTMTVADGQFKGRKLFDMIALEHSNLEWAKGTQARLDAICPFHVGMPHHKVHWTTMIVRLRRHRIGWLIRMAQYNPNTRIAVK